MSARATPPVGGQALLHGVLMRGPSHLAIAVRRADHSIVVKVQPLPSWPRRFAAVPFVRGIAALVEAVTVGFPAFGWASAARGGARGRIRPSTVAAIAGAIVAFSVLPTLAHGPLAGRFGPVGATVADTVVQVALLVAYLAVVRRHAAAKRLFRYHGAEHKAVAAHEAGEPLDPMVAARYGRQHLRCGTTFVIDVLLIAMLFQLALVVLAPSGALLTIGRFAVLPVVAAVAYELLRAVASHPDVWWARLLAAPGLALQGLTTAEPDLDQLEVALAALAAAVTGSAAPALAARGVVAPSAA
ncbi:MAG TPA: DUF1385 domain-containing protein [Acidimicrobiales bacterium]|nr:DUF1385 domain-containing protein [Acidimicrobiales bacterium]